jgi:nucleotide-binding universal stress UspA family protein
MSSRLEEDIMFRKLLICSDLTPVSDALIQCVAGLRSIGVEEVVLAHVIHVADSPGLDDLLIEDVGLGLERQQKKLEEEGLQVTLEMPFGVPARAIEEIAEKHDVSAILIGSHGKGVIQAATLGSVSSELLHQTRRPVFLARMDLVIEGKGEAICHKLFENVLFATDFSETAERALDYLGKIALETGCPVTLLHVLGAREDDPGELQRREEEAGYLLEAKMRRLKTLGAAEVEIELVHGKPAQEIVARTRTGFFSLAVLGRQGKGVLKEIFLGSTANEVARHSGVPLLFIPGQE